MNNYLDSISAKFRALRERSGMSMDELAKEMGYKGASGIQRYESADYKRSYYDPQIVSKLAKAIVGRGNPPIEANEVWELSRPEAAPVNLDSNDHAETTRGLILIKGDVEAGSFREIDDSDEERYLGAAFPDLPLPQWAYQVRGESMNKKALPGQHWVATPYRDPKNDPAPGDYVVIERTRGHLRERSIKRLQFSRDGTPEFWPESNDERFKEPLRFEGDEDEQWQIVAKGLLVISKTF